MTSLTAEQKLKLLINFGNEISTEMRLKALLDKIAGKITGVLNCDRCIIYLLDKKNDQLWSTIAKGKGLEHTEIKIPLKNKSILNDAINKSKIINITKKEFMHTLTMHIDLVTEYKTENLLLVPIKTEKGKILGLFQVSNKLDGTDFDADDQGILVLLGAMTSNFIQVSKLYENLRLSQLETIYRLAITAEYRDQKDTPLHLKHISIISYLLAKKLKMKDKHAEYIKHASPLHDIGKVGVPDKVLLKPDKLTEEEFEFIKKHPTYGGKILEGAKSGVLKTAYKITVYHHEKYDGTGYPYGLKGENIPIEARIVSVADVFDALCMKRKYKDAWNTDDAFDYIVKKSGTDFDPKVVSAFKKIYPKIKSLYYKDMDSTELEDLSFSTFHKLPINNNDA